MRMWSLHPKHLDAKGIVALWRETLLAQKVLMNLTKGYKHHPQLLRFKSHRNPLGAIAAYLQEIQKESVRRGYKFDASKIQTKACRGCITVTIGQLIFETKHLIRKLKIRDKQAYLRLKKVKQLSCHPLFKVVPGEIETWER